MLKKFFYIAEKPISEGHSLIKIGITDSPDSRIKALAGKFPGMRLKAVFEFKNRAAPHRVESLLIQYYRPFRAFGKEFFYGDYFHFLHSSEGAIDSVTTKYMRVL